MKNTLIFFAIILFVVGFCLGGYKILPQYKAPQISNPFLDFDTLADACEYAEFDFVIPSDFENVTEKRYRVLRSEKKTQRLIEVIYLIDENTELLRFRKSFGKFDISGDRTRYKVTEDADVGSVLIKLKGMTEGFYNATWSVNVHENGEVTQYAYSIMTGKPFSRAEFVKIASEVF